MKRTKEITIVHYRRRRKKRTQPATIRECPVCGSDAELISLAAALQLTGVSRSTLKEWIDAQQVHATQSSARRFFICRRSLLLRLSAVKSEK